MTRVPPAVLVLGLGNDVLSDDAVGLHVAREVRERLQDRPEVVVTETIAAGLSLLEQIAGSSRLVLVDAAQTGMVPAGTISEWSLQEEPARRIAAPHSVGIYETIALGHRLEMPMPDLVQIFTVEVQDAATLGFGLTQPVQAAVNATANRIIALVESWIGRKPDAQEHGFPP